VKTLTYEVTLTDGVETDRELLRSEITKKPVTQVIVVGTKEEPQQEPSCDPNYSGGCVPIASDVQAAAETARSTSKVWSGLPVPISTAWMPTATVSAARRD
jgi:resuscitation-promoting factor RpfB